MQLVLVFAVAMLCALIIGPIAPGAIPLVIGGVMAAGLLFAIIGGPQR